MYTYLEITICYKNTETQVIKAQKNENLLQFLIRNNIYINSPCGGNGTCGKCAVIIKDTSVPPNKQEQELFSSFEIAEGYRLACTYVLKQNTTVLLLTEENSSRIMTSFNINKVKLNPLINIELLKLEKPSLEIQASDIERLYDAMSASNSHVLDTDIELYQPSLDVMRKLPELIKNDNDTISAIIEDSQIISIDAQNKTELAFYGIAVDIGTTTIAAYLYDLSTGTQKQTFSLLNPQRKYGADVITRIDFTLKSNENKQIMHDCIISALNQLISEMCLASGISVGDIYIMTIVGNTTMLHFLMALDARNIAMAPFIPVTTLLNKLDPSELNIKINNFGKVVILPSISAYIGADTVGAIISTGMDKKKTTTLLIDIGTNGEIVLGNKDALYTCSTAAGPAFEGANIKYGCGGISGAISSVQFDEGSINCTTINDTEAIGICGSGLIDAVAEMIRHGLIDDTGRIISEDELTESNIKYKNYIYQIEGFPALKLGDNTEVFITQNDIRELQNAKAAIAAGIETLILDSGNSNSSIKEVYLAGGFGSYLNIESALILGLLPSALKGKIKAIGNAAGAGAVQALLSKKEITRSQKLKGKTKYLELSSSLNFVTSYTDNMFFNYEI